LFVLYFRGLLSGHIFAQHFKENSNHLQWYNGELLAMAKDLGYRLMPAFNTTTGIPYSRVKTKIIYYLTYLLLISLNDLYFVFCRLI